MKKALTALLLVCMLASGPALAEAAPVSPDFYDPLSFGMTADEVLGVYEDALNDPAVPSVFEYAANDDDLRFYAVNGPLTHSWNAHFIDGSLVYTNTVSRPEDYGELVLPYLADKYGQADTAAFEADEYRGWSEMLIERLGEPDHSSETDGFAQAPDYGNPVLGLTGVSDYIRTSSSYRQYTALRCEQWVKSADDGTRVLIHHMELASSAYLLMIGKDGEKTYENTNMDTRGQVLQFILLP